MPVTAKLSKLFYERLGDQVVNGVAEWLNQVDQSYRSELREINEMNFARFEAKLEQRVAHLEAKMERRFGEQTRWLFAGWVTIILAMIGLWARR